MAGLMMELGGNKVVLTMMALRQLLDLSLNQVVSSESRDGFAYIDKWLE